MGAITGYVDLPERSGGLPVVACRTEAGWLVVRFLGGDCLTVSTPYDDEARYVESDRAVIVRGVSYSGSTTLRPRGWGDDPEHERHYSSWRRARAAEPGWLDREGACHFRRVDDLSRDPSDSARKKLRALCEDVARELVEARPELVALGRQSELRREIQREEDRLEEAERTVEQCTRRLERLRDELWAAEETAEVMPW